MRTTSRIHARQIFRRIHTTWTELDHAQRRLLEIRTGVTGLTLPDERRLRQTRGDQR